MTPSISRTVFTGKFKLYPGDSPYIRALPAQTLRFIAEAILNKTALPSPQVFSYATVSSLSFNSYYANNGWQFRKLTALPSCCYFVALCIKELVVQAIFRIFYGKTDVAAVRLFHFSILRNLQEAMGWIVTLLSDRYGQYLVEDSQFQRCCYQSFDLNPKMKISVVTAIAENWINRNTHFKVFRLIKQGVFSYRRKKFLYEKMMIKSFQDNCPINFMYTIKLIQNPLLRKEIYLGYIQQLVNNSYFDLAIETVHTNLARTKEVMDLLEKISAICIQKNVLDKAVKIINYLQKDKRDALSLKLAKIYSTKKQLTPAIRLITKSSIHIDQQRQFLSKLAVDFFVSGNISAIQSVIELSRGMDAEKLAPFFTSLATSVAKEQVTSFLKKLGYLDPVAEKLIIVPIFRAQLKNHDGEMATAVIGHITTLASTEHCIKLHLLIELAQYYDQLENQEQHQLTCLAIAHYFLEKTSLEDKQFFYDSSAIKSALPNLVDGCQKLVETTWNSANRGNVTQISSNLIKAYEKYVHENNVLDQLRKFKQNHYSFVNIFQDILNCCQQLGFENNEEITERSVKKAFRTQALLTHPDTVSVSSANYDQEQREGNQDFPKLVEARKRLLALVIDKAWQKLPHFKPGMRLTVAFLEEYTK